MEDEFMNGSENLENAKEGLERLEGKMAEHWMAILDRPLSAEIKKILASGDRRLYAMWLCQVAHMTRHTSAHQALVGTRFSEISFQYAKFCFEHAAEEVGHEMMAVHDLKKIGVPVEKVDDLPPELSSTKKLNAYLYHVAERGHPATRLGFSFWAEKCYPFIQMLVGNSLRDMGLVNSQMTFFVSHSAIDEKHARDVEHVLQFACKTKEDWEAVETGMHDTLELAVDIFEEIHTRMSQGKLGEDYSRFLKTVEEGARR
jgi:hypothetical protein